jgi:hypothetical protein
LFRTFAIIQNRLYTTNSLKKRNRLTPGIKTIHTSRLSSSNFLDEKSSKLNSVFILSSHIWSFPDCPGMFHLQEPTHEKCIKFSGITGYDKSHHVVELVPSLTEDQLQIATARIFYALLQCHPTFWSLDSETKEVLFAIYFNQLDFTLVI